MRKSLASIVGNLGNTIGFGTPSASRNSQREIILSPGPTRNGLATPKVSINVSPPRPIGLPPPLPYNNNPNNDINYPRKNNLVETSDSVPSSIENTKVFTPFKLGVSSLSRARDASQIEEDFLGTSQDRTPLTKSLVRIKSAGIGTPRRIEDSRPAYAGYLAAAGNKESTLFGGPLTSQMFTPSTSRTRLFPVMEAVPGEPVLEEDEASGKNVNDENIEINKDPELDTVSTMKIRLNEKSQEIHFLRKTIKDLEQRISSFDDKEKLLIESEVFSKKKIEELLNEKKELSEKIRLLDADVHELKQEKSNILNDNNCLSSSLELKCFEVNKLNLEIDSIHNAYRNNFTSKYLTPLKNVLFELITELQPQIGNDNTIDVDFQENNMEMNAVIKTIHEYLQSFRNVIAAKINQDSNIIEKLHSELNSLNKENAQLKQEIRTLSSNVSLPVNDADQKAEIDLAQCDEEPSSTGESRPKTHFGLKNIAKSIFSYTYIGRNSLSDSSLPSNELVDKDECESGNEKRKPKSIKGKEKSKQVIKTINKKSDSGKALTKKTKSVRESRLKKDDLPLLGSGSDNTGHDDKHGESDGGSESQVPKEPKTKTKSKSAPKGTSKPEPKKKRTASADAGSPQKPKLSAKSGTTKSKLKTSTSGTTSASPSNTETKAKPKTASKSAVSTAVSKTKTKAKTSGPKASTGADSEKKVKKTIAR
ncbi:hypothetical protein HWI79_2973 [Cryptosporidium felis]|nr:hypothetical protein HWI79_2973 [Cryptosporidium felis]